MSPRPLIFISAVSRELKSAQQLVANTLIFLGYQPVWQDIFGTETGDLRGLLRQQIAFTIQRDRAEPPLATASIANIENCFIESNLVIAPASGWLERLVRPD